MSELARALLAIVGGIITLAIVAVVVSRKSATAEDVGAVGASLSRVISAAVNPAATAATNGDLGRSSFATPSLAPLFTLI